MPNWSSQITLGNIITALTIVVCFAVTYGKLETRVSNNEKAIHEHSGEINALEARLTSVALSAAQSTGEVNGNLASIRAEIAGLRQLLERMN